MCTDLEYHNINRIYFWMSIQVTWKCICAMRFDINSCVRVNGSQIMSAVIFCAEIAEWLKVKNIRMQGSDLLLWSVGTRKWSFVIIYYLCRLRSLFGNIKIHLHFLWFLKIEIYTVHVVEILSCGNTTPRLSCIVNTVRPLHHFVDDI